VECRPRNGCRHAMEEHVVTVPAGILPGADLLVEVGGGEYYVTVPSNCVEGSTFVVLLPPATADAALDIEVIVPDGCTAGDTFIVQHERGEFAAVVPDGCGPGSAVVISVPPASPQKLPLSPQRTEAASAPAAEELSGSSDSDTEEEKPTFPIGLPVEVMRNDGNWTLVTVTEYDAGGDTYTVQLVDGRLKYFVEPELLRLPAFMLKTTGMI